MADLFTIDKLKARLKIGGSTLNQDEENDLARLVTEVSSRFQAEAGCDLVEAARVDTFDGNGRARYWLKHGAPSASGDLWTITADSVVVDGEPIPEIAGAVTEGWSLAGSRINLTGYLFTEGTDNCVVTYSSGFDAAAIPSDIEGACIELAALRWKEGDRIGQVAKTVSGEVIDFRGSNVWSTFLAVAGLYRRVSV